ncbi:hypothetical protein QGX21_gp071 [Pseudomonas phage phiPsa315]|uniref:Uncharacterized protein n=1 Tax=Pseudomonas phage phiPsa315 TaxID=1460363 RepID=A0A7G9V225_9CAUD|nr:hypothetical protein QGX21_gp071 [Pseudomonas phage phiPsa315]QNO00331.1 hypothetical protein phiPsa315_155 [Pseudomonas phage phiPsa315]
MAYKLKCKDCGHTYIAEQRYFNCERPHCKSQNTSFVEEVIDTALDVALAYTGVTAAIEVADVVGGFVGSIFDWD